MARFYYKGKNLAGKEISGIYEAKDKVDVAFMIKQKGFFPTLIRPRYQGVVGLIGHDYARVNAGEMATFCKQLGAMIESGINLSDALHIIKDKMENKSFKKVIEHVLEDVKQGSTFTDACKNYSEVFSSMFINLVGVGELSGHLEDVMKRLSGHFDDISRRMERIKSAMIYPAMLSITTFIVVIFLISEVLPIFTSIFSQAGLELPFMTKMLLEISQHLGIYFLAFLAGAIILLFALNQYSSTAGGAYFLDKLKLTVPIVGPLYGKTIALNICKMLFILISSGFPLLKALDEIEKNIESEVYRLEIRRIKQGVFHGRSLSEMMDDTSFPSFMVKMIQTGEETGKLEEMLEKVVVLYKNEVETWQERLLSLIEPTIIAAMAFIIGFIVISVVLPMFSIYNIY